MGSFRGHALPGSLFVMFGLWWMLHSILEYAASLNQSTGGKHRTQTSNMPRSWRAIPSKYLRSIPFEPVLKLFGALGGIMAELSPISFQLVDESNRFTMPNRFAHSTMYGFFALSGLFELLNLYKVTHFTREAEYVVLAIAFAVEGTLFSFHLHGRDMFDVRIHTLLYIVIYLVAVVILLEACTPARFRRELFMARSVLVLTQGTWFWEIAYTLYGPKKWFSNAKKDLTEKELMLDTELITVCIMWHLLFWTGVLLFCCVVVNFLHKRERLPVCCMSYGNVEKSPTSQLNEKHFAPENYISDEEEILLKRDAGKNKNESSKLLINEIDEEASF